MFRPKLTKFASSNPFAKAIGQLNQAVSDQAGTRPGPGMGMMSGPSGRQIVLNAPILMLAKAKDTIPAATLDADGNPVLGKGDAYMIAVTMNDDDDRVMVPRKEDTVEVHNLTGSAIEKNQIFFLVKILNIRLVVNSSVGIARAKVTAAIPGAIFDSPSDSGKAQVYHKNPDGEWAASGDPVTVWNDHNFSPSVPIGTTIKIASIDGDWYLIAADCPS